MSGLEGIIIVEIDAAHFAGLNSSVDIMGERGDLQRRVGFGLKSEQPLEGVFSMTRVFRHPGAFNNLFDSLFGAVDAIHDPGR
jgi:hypothetical protein